MKTLAIILSLAAAAVLIAACAPKKKVLVLYYSQTENTKALAEAIQTKLGADIEEIVALQPYDGNFKETIDRCLVEREQGVLPEIQPLKSKIADYDLIFIGYPVWFGTYAPPVAQLLKDADFSGKKVVPFCTFGSGGLQSSAMDMEKALPNAEILPGYGVRAARMEAMPAEIDQFLKAGGYLKGEFAKLEPFPAEHPVSEVDAALFDEAVGDYPMMHARAKAVAARTVPGGTEYLFTAEQLPMEGAPTIGLPEMKVYVLDLDGKKPEFTQVIR